MSDKPLYGASNKQYRTEAIASKESAADIADYIMENEDPLPRSIKKLNTAKVFLCGRTLFHRNTETRKLCQKHHERVVKKLYDVADGNQPNDFHFSVEKAINSNELNCKLRNKKISDQILIPLNVKKVVFSASLEGVILFDNGKDSHVNCVFTTPDNRFYVIPTYIA